MQTLGAKFRMKGCFFDLAKRENVVLKKSSQS